MPKVKNNNKYKKIYCEKQIEDAIKAIKNGMTQRTASKKYGVPRSTIQFRMSNEFVKTPPGPSPVLGSEEHDLVNWIIDCQRKGFPARKINIQASVKEFLDKTKVKNPFRDNLPGSGWYKGLLKRHPILTERCPEGVTSASACVGENDIRNWFAKIYNYLSDNNYLHILEDSSRIFNSDETYFMICPKMKNVIAVRGTQNVYEIDKGNSKMNLTVLFTFSANGVTTPPTVVFPYKRLPAAVGQSVPDDWGLGVTPTGWMSADLFFQYLKNIFYPYLKKEKVTFPVILFVDGHSSHITLEVSKLCSELEIILICLYPNATRILQPADVSAFKPLKSMWQKSVLEWRQQNPTQSLTLDRMAPLLKNAVDKFSPDGNIVRNGFKTCGLYPWNPDAIDYTKCLGVKSRTIKPILTDYPSNTSTVSFETYSKIVGDNLLKELQIFSSQQTTAESKSQEFLILYQLFNEYAKASNLANHNLQSTIDSDVEDKLEPSIKNTNMTQDDFKDSLLLNHTIEVTNETDNNCNAIDNLNSNNVLAICENKSQITSDLEVNNTIAINETECDMIYTLELNNEISTDNIRDDILNDSEFNNISLIIDEIENSIINDPNINNIMTNNETGDNNPNNLNFNNIITLVGETENNLIDNIQVNNVAITNETVCNNINNLEFSDDAKIIDETDNYTVLDLSLNHRKDCFKTLKDFLPRFTTPKRKGKKFTEQTSYAISSSEWKLNEQKKLDQIKMEQKRKDNKKQQMLEKKKLADKLKEQKQFARKQKQQENDQKKKTLKIKKEKVINKENIDNKKPKRINKKESDIKPKIVNNKVDQKKICLVKDKNVY